MPADNLGFELDGFSGIARLFPLPNLVMFPHVMQPLHIFEPRYRALLEEALEMDKLIGIALLSEGWEAEYEGRPPLRPIACLCRVAHSQRTEQGTYNILALGIERIQIVRELPPHKLFREAEVQILADVYPDSTASHRIQLQQELLDHFKQSLPQIPQVHEQYEQLLSAQIPLGTLTDLIGYSLDLPIPERERLLAEPNVDLRAAFLLDRLTLKHSVPRSSPPTFPPDFSHN